MGTGAELAQAGAEGLSLVDGGTVIVGLIIVAIKIGWRFRTKQAPAISVRPCAIDFLNGIVIVPFGMMVLGALMPSVMEHLHDSKVSIAIAGVIGLFFVLGEIFSRAEPKS